MSPLSDILLLILAVCVVAYLTLRLVRTRLEVREDLEHLGRLLGRSAPPDVQQAEEEKEPGALARRLAAAGLEITPVAAVGLVALLSFVAALAVVTFTTSPYWAGLVAGLAVAWLISSTVTEAARQRAWRFENRLVDAIDLVARRALCGSESRRGACERCRGGTRAGQERAPGAGRPAPSLRSDRAGGTPSRSSLRLRRRTDLHAAPHRQVGSRRTARPRPAGGHANDAARLAPARPVVYADRRRANLRDCGRDPAVSARGRLSLEASRGAVCRLAASVGPAALRLSDSPASLWGSSGCVAF